MWRMAQFVANRCHPANRSRISLSRKENWHRFPPQGFTCLDSLENSNPWRYHMSRSVEAKTFILLGIALWASILAGGARGELILRNKAGQEVKSVDAYCGGDSFKGLELVYTMTDKAGSVFTVNCEDRT